MDKKILELTNAVYKVLEFFPESDPLKNRAKNKVLEIMENFELISGTDGWTPLKVCFSETTAKTKKEILKDIDVLLDYFRIAKSQGWLSGINFFIISNEYEKIKKEIEIKPEISQNLPKKETEIFVNSEKTDTQNLPKPLIVKKKEVKAESPATFNISKRQEKIIEFLNKNEKAQVMDLQKVLENVTKRTIRRDLDELMKSSRIERIGEFNQVFYRNKN